MIKSGDLVHVHSCFGYTSPRGVGDGLKVHVDEGPAIFLGEVSTDGWWKGSDKTGAGIKILTSKGQVWVLAGSAGIRVGEVYAMLSGISGEPAVPGCVNSYTYKVE